MPVSKPDSALLLLGHGSTENPDSSRSTWEQAGRIEQAGNFGSVHCAFWKEEPSFRQIWPMIEEREVYVVPNFVSEGYFTRQVIPRELELAGSTTEKERHLVHYCDPVGIHPKMTELLRQRAHEIISDEQGKDDAALFLVGHGTGLNSKSREAVRKQAEAIRKAEQKCSDGFAEVLDTYMEEAPFIKDWQTLTKCPTVVVVPFFIADGLHSFEDIPVLLGIEPKTEVFTENPHRIGDRTLFYCRSIGMASSLCEVILDQVTSFDEHYRT